MKKTLLYFLSIVFLSCGGKTHITSNQFENDLRDIFDIMLYKINDTTKIAYNFGMHIDSASIYYDLVKEYNNQSLIYFTRKPFIQVDFSNILVDQDTIIGAKKEIYKVGKTQQWFDYYKTAVAYYLLGKGISVENYELKKLILVTQDELMEIVSKFYYVYDYEYNFGLKAKVCGGINPYVREELVINPLVEAFAFQALVNLILKDKSINTLFYNELIPKLNKEIQTMIGEKNDIVKYAKNYVYQHYKNDLVLQQKIIAQYLEQKDYLPFRIVDLE